MQKNGDTSASHTPHLTKTPPTPPPDKEQPELLLHSPPPSSYAASDTYTEDEFVVIEWEEDEAERAIDLTHSADLSSSADLTSCAGDEEGEHREDLSSSSLSSSQHQQQAHSFHGLPHGNGMADHMKRDWYQVWLHDKTVEKSDPWGFSSTGVSRTASPARNGTAAA